jgi:hypothetical protein
MKQIREAPNLSWMFRIGQVISLDFSELRHKAERDRRIAACPASGFADLE